MDNNGQESVLETVQYQNQILPNSKEILGTLTLLIGSNPIS